MRRFILVGMLAVLLGMGAIAQTAEEIMKKVQEQGFLGLGLGRGSLYVAFTLEKFFAKVENSLKAEIKFEQVAEAKSVFRLWVKEYPDGTVKVLLLYPGPEHTVGTRLLAHISPEGKVWMWQYFPELGILKEWKWKEECKGECLPRDILVRYEATLLGEDTLDAYPVWRLELRPKTIGVEWSKILVWVHRAHNILVRAEFYDGYGNLSEILSVPELTADEMGVRPALIRFEGGVMNLWAEVRIVERSTADVPDEYFEPKNLGRPSF